ncbi:uncharacterized protein [Manis javanica]|uniref:uncharacterized protein n=1 Tax=Manis javanica TaxID=9974 RepID=UPI003C6D8068
MWLRKQAKAWEVKAGPQNSGEYGQDLENERRYPGARLVENKAAPAGGPATPPESNHPFISAASSLPPQKPPQQPGPPCRGRGRGGPREEGCGTPQHDHSRGGALRAERSSQRRQSLPLTTTVPGARTRVGKKGEAPPTPIPPVGQGGIKVMKAPQTTTRGLPEGGGLIRARLDGGGRGQDCPDRVWPALDKETSWSNTSARAPEIISQVPGIRKRE